MPVSITFTFVKKQLEQIKDTSKKVAYLEKVLSDIEDPVLEEEILEAIKPLRKQLDKEKREEEEEHEEDDFIDKTDLEKLTEEKEESPDLRIELPKQSPLEETAGWDAPAEKEDATKYIQNYQTEDREHRLKDEVIQEEAKRESSGQIQRKYKIVSKE